MRSLFKFVPKVFFNLNFRQEHWSKFIQIHTTKDGNILFVSEIGFLTLSVSLALKEISLSGHHCLK